MTTRVTMTTGDMMDRTADGMTAPTDSSSSSAAAPSARRGLAAAVGAVGAAFLASLCCVGPLLFVTLGVGAGLASTFEPLRPLFGAVMLALLGAGFWAVYGRRATRSSREHPSGAAVVGGGEAGCAPGGACPTPARRGRDVVVLWCATLVALVLWTFPTWSLWLL